MNQNGFNVNVHAFYPIYRKYLMSGTLIAIIILAAIFGGYIIDYQKNKLKWQAKNAETNEDYDELKSELDRMRKRIENLEAIVTDESAFKDYSSHYYSDIEYTDQTLKGNERKAAKKVKNKGD